MISRLIFYALFAVSVIQKFIGSEKLAQEAAKAKFPDFVYGFLKPNLELVFILGCGWLIHKAIRRFIFGEYRS